MFEELQRLDEQEPGHEHQAVEGVHAPSIPAWMLLLVPAAEHWVVMAASQAATVGGAPLRLLFIPLIVMEEAPLASAGAIALAIRLHWFAVRP